MIEPINQLPIIQSTLMTEQISASQTQTPVSFAHWFAQQMGEVERTERVAQNGLLELATGQSDNLHQVMINIEEAKLSFQLLLQVRNRALEAYQEVMRMQI